VNVERLEYFKNKLFEEKEKLLESKEKNMQERYGSIDMYPNELSGYDNHPADVGTEVFMKEQDQGFQINIDNKLNEVESSIQMIDEGNYGRCIDCNKKIKEERLRLIPYIKTCLECTKKEEVPMEFRQFESIADEYATKLSNKPASNVIYDREDTYQDIAADNIVPGDPSMSTGDNIGLSDDEETNGTEKIEDISQEYYDETMK